eukprot:Seg8737.1 transcript_id=Seg8737.1/GoldUCD/mRNA.D3Y31 product="hypothetical protein" protein_id=Seg8737.1/GoldUCD/D3Y31
MLEMDSLKENQNCLVSGKAGIFLSQMVVKVEIMVRERKDYPAGFLEVILMHKAVQ